MSEQSNERTEADIALRSIMRRAENRISADRADVCYLQGQYDIVTIHLDHDAELAKLAQAAIDLLRARSRDWGGND